MFIFKRNCFKINKYVEEKLVLFFVCFLWLNLNNRESLNSTKYFKDKC